MLKEYDRHTRRKEFIKEILTFMCYGVVAIIAAIYVGNILFGQSSLQTLLSLEATKKELNERIAQFKQQNAAAQKDYFELKGLYPK